MVCEKKEHRIGGAVAVVVLIIVLVIVLSVTLTSDSDNDSSSSSSSSSSGNPNILFIVVDDLGWTDLSINGESDCEYETENIDDLFTNGIEFSNYYVHPVCTPTRASFLTGKYGWQLGLQDMQTMPPGVDEQIPDDTPTIAELLNEDGDLGLNYKTYYVGKWHLGYATWDMTPTGRGFDYGYGMLQAHGDFYTHIDGLSFDGGGAGSLPGYDMFDLTSQTIDWTVDGNYSTDVFYNKAIEYLQDYVDNFVDDYSFYFYLSWQTIHEPIDYYGETYDDICSGSPRETYCNKMVHLDKKIGELIDFLKDNSLYDNTLIVFTTDNGGMPQMAQPGSINFDWPVSDGCNYPYRAGKTTLFEGGVKARGVISGELVSSFDKFGDKSKLLIHAADWVPTLIDGFIGESLSSVGVNVGGINFYSYINGDYDESEFVINEREYLPINLDLSNAINKTSFDILNSQYIPGNFSTIIWNDIETNTMWKYIIGENVYWNHYNCENEIIDNIDGLDLGSNVMLYGKTREWLFNLTDNPYESELYNYLSPDITNETIEMHGLTYNEIQNLREQLQNEILDIIANNDYIQGPQEGTHLYISAFPPCHNNTWSPWLDSNYEPIVDITDTNDCKWQENGFDLTVFQSINTTFNYWD